MEIHGDYLNNFRLYLIELRNDLNKSIKENSNIISSDNKFEIDKYKSLVFRKYQIEYFIQLIRRNDVLDESELFISYKALSDLIYASPLSIEDKFKSAVYFFNINSKSVQSGNISMPRVESIFDNFNCLMDLSLNRIKSFSSEKNIYRELSDTNSKAFKIYSKKCDSISSMYKLTILSMIECIKDGFENLDFHRIEHIIECISSLDLNPNFVEEVKDFLFAMYSKCINGDNTLITFEDYSSWFQQACDDLNVESIYIMMLKISIKIVENKDEDRTEYYCELDGYMKYIIKSVIEKYGNNYEYPIQLKNFRKTLK